MGARSRRRFGSIRRLPSGRLQVRYPNASGVYVPAPNTFERIGDADRFLTRVEADLMRGEYRDPALARTTVAVWAERWYATSAHLAPKTQIAYRSILDRHVLPAMGDEMVGSVDTPALRALLSDMLASDMQKATVVKIKAVIRMVLATAVEGGAIKANPAVGIKLGAVPHKEKVFLSPAQVQDLVYEISNPPRPARHAAASRPDLGLLVHFAAYTGLRAGELAALEVRRLDLLRRRVEVVQAVSEIPGKGMVFGPTKNRQSRTVPIPRFLVDQLAEHTSGRAANDLVFTSASGAVIRQTNLYKRYYLPAVERAGLPSATRFHDLRHTFAAMSIAARTDPYVLMRWMGHSSIHVTYGTYGHLIEGVEEAAANRLNELGASSGPTSRAEVRRLRNAPETGIPDAGMARVWHDDRSEVGDARLTGS